MLYIPSEIFAVSSTGIAMPVLSVTSEGCNNNGICEPDLGEDSSFCFNDCGCNNNGICELSRLETELNCPADCATTPIPGGGGGNIDNFVLYIENLEISNITFDSAKISWQTNKLSVCKIYVGQTSGYEKETISETQNLTNHFFVLANLTPSTVYHFNVYCDNGSGLTTETGDKYFATLITISNVSNFVATAGENDIVLTWENPTTPDFKSVTIVKNLEFYPATIDDGTVIYSGSEEFFVDTDVVKSKNYYYTIFSEGKNGSISSGAITSGIIPVEEITIPTEETESPLTMSPTITAPISKILKFSDFDFYSNGIKLSVIDEKIVKPEADKILIISINKDKVPSSYKKMIAKLEVGDNNFYYLFSLNKFKTVYSTNLIAPSDSGNYPLTIIFVGENNKIISKVQGELSIWKSQTISKFWFWTWIKTKITIILIIIFLIIILLFLFWRWFFILAKDDDDEKKNRKKEKLENKLKKNLK